MICAIFMICIPLLSVTFVMYFNRRNKTFIINNNNNNNNNIIYNIYRALIPNGPKALYIIKITTKS